MTEVAARPRSASTSATDSGAVDSGQYEQLAAGLREVFESGRTRGYEWRIRQLDGLLRFLTERADDMVAALDADLRRTAFEASMFDIGPTKAEVKYARARLRRWMRPRKVSPGMGVLPAKAWTHFEPVGVAGIIAPWNYPLHLALTPLASALAAGNCAVIKPSELAPACSRLLAEQLPDYVDADAVKVVEGAADATLGLIGQGLDHCFFTGSPEVGRAIMAAAALHLTPVTLELGGKCPVLVTSSADIEVTARRVAFGKLANSGQTCVAPDYVLVDRKVSGEFVAAITRTITAFSEGREVLPIVNQRHAQRIAGLLEGHGGTVALGGTADTGEATVEPTVIVDPDLDSPLMREEIFGPVLPVVAVDSLDEALAHVRTGGRPLASYLFSRDRADERAVLNTISAGATVVNHVMFHVAVPGLPFGGTGTSGMGRYHGVWGFETFSNARAVLRKPFKPDPSFLYPPRSERAQKIMGRML